MSVITKNALAGLSDSQLIRQLDDLVKKERQTILDIIRHLIEMDRRSLYLGRGYSSLFEYCTRHLGYSESAAFRRIKTARCIRDFPEVYEMLSKNEVNLSTAAKLSGILDADNKNILLKEVRFQSARKVDSILARYRPVSILRERVRPVFVKKSPDTLAPAKPNATSEVNNGAACKSGQKFTADVGGKKPATCDDIFEQGSVLEQKFKLEFAVDPEFMKKLEEARALLSKKYPRGLSFEILFEAILDEYLEKHSPARKIQRREKRRAKKNEQQEKTSKPKQRKQTRATTAARKNVKRSRHIPQAVQNKVFMRDKERCTFVGSDGTKCNSMWNLEIDHIKPFARGGDHSIHNLRLLCAKHNHHAAERIYGRGFMDRHRYKTGSVRE